MANFTAYLIALLSFLVPQAISQSFQRSGQTVQVDGNSYYVPPTSVAEIPGYAFFRIRRDVERAGGLLPLTVITTTFQGFGNRDFGSTVDRFVAEDDVFTRGFLQG